MIRGVVTRFKARIPVRIVRENLRIVRDDSRNPDGSKDANNLWRQHFADFRFLPIVLRAPTFLM
jgi:hypothetical protein